MEGIPQKNARLRQYAQNRGKNMPPYQAARAAGYSESYAKVAAFRLDKKPEVIAEISAVQQVGRVEAGFSLAQAMQQAAEDWRFARLNKNSMAATQID